MLCLVTGHVASCSKAGWGGSAAVFDDCLSGSSLLSFLTSPLSLPGSSFCFHFSHSRCARVGTTGTFLLIATGYCCRTLTLCSLLTTIKVSVVWLGHLFMLVISSITLYRLTHLPYEEEPCSLELAPSPLNSALSVPWPPHVQ